MKNMKRSNLMLICLFIFILMSLCIPVKARLIIKTTADFTKATKDAYVDKHYPTYNYGDKSYFYVGKGDYADQKYESYFYFPLDNIPDEWTKAEISLDINYIENLISLTVYLITESWSEDSITWNNKPAHGDVITDFTINDEGVHIFDVSNYISGNSLSICINASASETDYLKGKTKEVAYSYKCEEYPQIIWDADDLEIGDVLTDIFLILLNLTGVVLIVIIYILIKKR